MDAVKEGLVFVLQFDLRGTSNSMVSGCTDPKTTIPWHTGTRVGFRRPNGQPSKLELFTRFLDTHDFQ
ncbi:hypothetical protein [Deinococcus misasensis]|uniref:hypothetical protein n=1 Tax=Deinococcus misasensis TaxID=392413 RepID=UPI00055698EC|nr:hypothetical protein [Deinococcus misasensis]